VVPVERTGRLRARSIRASPRGSTTDIAPGLRGHHPDRRRRDGSPSHLLPARRYLARAETRGHWAVVKGAIRSLRNPAGFALREFITGTVGTYRMRRSHVRIVIRHGTSDTMVFHEIFNRREYDALLLGLPPGDRPQAPTIVDLGAHVGLFCARAIAAYPKARITAVEPDSRNLKLLHRCANLNGAGGRWTIVEAGAYVREGTTRFIEDGSWVSRVEGIGAPPAGLDRGHPRRLDIPTVDALELMDGAYFVKIDIEGSEWPLLDDPRLREISAERLSVEYHAWSCPHDDPHDAATTLLREAGYAVTTLRRGAVDGTLLAVKRSSQRGG
jgi:FkbM family methyltransferase